LKLPQKIWSDTLNHYGSSMPGLSPSRREDEDQVVQEGDLVLIDFQGFIDGSHFRRVKQRIIHLRSAPKPLFLGLKSS